MPCPECRTEFQIPKNGVAGLPERTFVRSSNTSLKAVGDYCVEHQERLRMYCLECNMNVCSTCCLEAHKSHKFDRVEKVVETFVRSIDEEIGPVTMRIECLNGVAAHVDSEQEKLLDNIRMVEQKIEERGQRVKRSVDLQVSDLLQELQSLKADAQKEAESHKGRIRLAVTEMDSFITSSLELKSKSDTPSLLTQAVRDVNVRAKQLLETHAIPDEFRIPTYEFTPVDIDVDQNYIGHVFTAEESGTKSGIFNLCLVFNVYLSALFQLYSYSYS